MFPFSGSSIVKTMIYFDNAATTFPKPRTILPALQNAVLYYGGNPGRSGHTISMKTSEKVFEVRKKAAEFFNAEVENTIFATNCTHALNMAIKGVMKSGHAVTSCLEHNSVLRPLYALQKNGIITYNVADVMGNDQQILTEIEKNMRSDTKAVIITHGSNVIGRIMPIAKISELCHKRGVKLIVDAAQTAGVLPIDVKEMGFNILCMPGHKGLYGATGTGLMILNDIDPIGTLMEGGTGSVSNSMEQPDFNPDRYESGTANTVGILSLSAGLDYIKRKKPFEIYRHEMSICQYVYRELRKMNRVVLYQGDFEPGAYLPIVLFNIQGMTSMETAQELSDNGFALRGGLHCAPLVHERLDTLDIGGVRFSPGTFNTQAEAVYFINTVKKIIKNHTV